MDVGYNRIEIGTVTTITTLATTLFPHPANLLHDLPIIILDPGATEVLFCHLGDGHIPERCDKPNRVLGVGIHKDSR